MDTQPNPKKDNSQKYTIFNFITKYLKYFRWQVIGLIFVSCYWAIHISLQPYIIKLILDRANQNPVLSNLIEPVLYYIMLALVFTLNFRFYDYICINLYPQLKAAIISDATSRITHYSYSFFQDQLAGSLTDKIKNLSKNSQEIVQIFIDKFFSHFIALIVACITLATVHPILALILLVWTAILVGISVSVTNKARVLSRELSESNSQAIGSVVDILSNILNVRLFNGFSHERKNLDFKLGKMIKKDMRLRWLLLKVMLAQGVFTAIMISASVLVLVLFVQSKHITIGDFGLVLTLSLSFADIIFHLAQEIATFSEVYGMVSQGIVLLNRDVDIQDAPHARDLKIIKGEIRFDKIHFNYPNSAPLFNNQSIIIHGGEKVGLVGYSGSGKSTFVNLILRLYDLNKGEILIDNQNIKIVTQSSLHRSIGVIPQESTLFHRSLMENIRYGIMNATDEEVIEAAKKAHAHDFIEKLPLGYETLVGERGMKLSGGQRQRIAIARAILKNGPILFLDEATSALDSVTESIVQDSLTELMTGKTTIIIAHRLSTLLHMDRILVFEKGKIVEDGTHKELLSTGGLYKTLWDAQVGGFIQSKPNRTAHITSTHLESKDAVLEGI
jgi:ATP-binding cassette subfamily B protein